MSYAVAAAFQSAVYVALASDVTLQGLVGGAVFDALPSGTPPPLYVSLGPETVTDASDKTGSGTWHKFTVTVMSDAPGFAEAKTVAGRICDILVGAELVLTRGRFVGLSFERASAARTDSDNGRKIDLRFKARIEDS